jgi:hypothetical protein
MNKKAVMGLVGSETKNDCADETNSKLLLCFSLYITDVIKAMKVRWSGAVLRMRKTRKINRKL